MAPPPRNRVDKERGIIRGVKLVSNYSKKGRRYPQHVLRAAIPLFESCAVYSGHADPGTRRSPADKIGRIVNVREAPDGNGLLGDLHYLPTHNLAESLAWSAENDPAQYGLSMNGNGPTRREPDGTETVMKITSVHSVDLVGNPATVDSLNECLQESLDGNHFDRWGKRTAVGPVAREAWLRRHRDGMALQEDTAPPAKVEPAAPPATTESHGSFRLLPASKQAAALQDFRVRCRSH